MNFYIESAILALKARIEQLNDYYSNEQRIVHMCAESMITRDQEMEKIEFEWHDAVEPYVTVLKDFQYMSNYLGGKNG